MAEIFTPKGQCILLDDSDYAEVSKYGWYIHTRTGYPIATICGEQVALHRMLSGAEPGQYVDHANANRTDARRANLRVCTHAENMRNRKRHANNKCGLKGVYKSGARWRAVIVFEGVKHSLGTHTTPEEAYKAYCAAAVRLHGDFARLE